MHVFEIDVHSVIRYEYGVERNGSNQSVALR